jgi:hypothetical protein
MPLHSSVHVIGSTSSSVEIRTNFKPFGIDSHQCSRVDHTSIMDPCRTVLATSTQCKIYTTINNTTTFEVQRYAGLEPIFWIPLAEHQNRKFASGHVSASRDMPANNRIGANWYSIHSPHKIF